MKKTPDFIEDRIKWRASQRSLPNKNVFLFENLNDKVKMKYLTHFDEENSGKIILLFTDSKKNWTALGTKMIIGYNGAKLNSIKLDSIQDVISKNLKEQYLQAEAGETKLKKIKKRNERELSVIDFNGNETVFITKKGNDFFSLWNIVLMITRLNK
ncbi:hypothetical protein [Aquimarina macrocephali]|uniref:hypothetical protein n=1 Tax=Aquimarina macrocephali TaxID=666563 RepID=UPI0004654EF4|nr:hypothetical protein [Aquimarina macrocephali]